MVEFLFAGLCICAVWALNLRFSIRDLRSDLKAAESRIRRYRAAVDEVDKWCGHESAEARLIAQFIWKSGEGFGANAGTPVADEFCSISGTRDQLSRMKRAQGQKGQA